MTKAGHNKLYILFAWGWNFLILAIAIWGVFSLNRLRVFPELPLHPEYYQFMTVVVLTFIMIVCLLIATCLHKRYPNFLGPVQLISSTIAFPIFKLIQQATPVSQDALLFKIDQMIWLGKSLPQWVMLLEHPILTEILSFCYATFYFIILFSGIYFAIKASARARGESKAFFYGLMLMYFFGFLGYIALPAAGPYAAFEQQFPYPLQGWVITNLLVDVVAKGITGMDVFPSLHTGITLYILVFYKMNGYRKVSRLLTPLFIGITLATVYLRYHYGIDVVLGILLALLILRFIRSYQQKGVLFGE